MNFLQDFISAAPMELIILFGSFIEEIFPPLPSPLIMMMAKMSSFSNGYSVFYFFLITFLATVGKTVGAFFLYVLGDKGEKVVISRFGRFFGLSHNDVKNLSARLKKGIKDEIILLIFRVAPIIPTTPVSIACGVIKINMVTFLITTFFGYFVRILIIFYIGIKALSSIKNNIDNYFYLTVFITIIIVMIIGWYFLKKKK